MIQSNIRVSPNTQISSTQKSPILKVTVFFSIKYLSVEIQEPIIPNSVRNFQEVIQTKGLLKISESLDVNKTLYMFHSDP